MISISSTISVHEGGTKFYQVYKIVSVRNLYGKSVVVTHWGKYNAGADMTPGSHGQSEIHKFDIGRSAREKMADMIASKTKRGYNNWQSKEDAYSNKEKFLDTLKGIFNGKSSEIISHLQVVIDNDDDFNGTVQLAKKNAETREAEAYAAIDRGPLWGEW